MGEIPPWFGDVTEGDWLDEPEEPADSGPIRTVKVMPLVIEPPPERRPPPDDWDEIAPTPTLYTVCLIIGGLSAIVMAYLVRCGHV